MGKYYYNVGHKLSKVDAPLEQFAYLAIEISFGYLPINLIFTL